MLCFYVFCFCVILESLAQKSPKEPPGCHTWLAQTTAGNPVTAHFGGSSGYAKKKAM